MWLNAVAAISSFGRHQGVMSQALTEPDPNCTPFLEEALDCIDSDETKRCAPLPIPSSAFGPIVDPMKGYFIENPRPGVYGVTEGTYWLMIFVGKDSKCSEEKKNICKSNKECSGKKKGNCKVKVLITDFPPTINAASALDEILFEMEGFTIEDIDEIMMFYSHDHLDHIGGAGTVHNHILATYEQDYVEIIASEGTFDLIQDRLQEGRWLTEKAPPATEGFEHYTALKLSKDMVVEMEVVSAHTEDRDVIVYLPPVSDDVEAGVEGEVAVLFFVDIAYAGWAPFYDAAIAADLQGYQRVLSKVLVDFDFVEGDYFCGGHLTKTGTRSDLELFKNMIDAAFAAAGKGLATTDAGPTLVATDFFMPGSRTFGNTWYASDVSIDLASRSCLKDMVSEFGCLLGGLDIMGYSMCHSIIIYYITET